MYRERRKKMGQLRPSIRTWAAIGCDRRLERASCTAEIRDAWWATRILFGQCIRGWATWPPCVRVRDATCPANRYHSFRCARALNKKAISPRRSGITPLQWRRVAGTYNDNAGDGHFDKSITTFDDASFEPTRRRFSGGRPIFIVGRRGGSDASEQIVQPSANEGKMERVDMANRQLLGGRTDAGRKTAPISTSSPHDHAICAIRAKLHLSSSEEKTDRLISPKAK